MPMLPEQFVHQVQQATDIVDLVSQYVTIKRKGKDYVGLCPFHQEKTPSFSVSPTKQIYKCFGCGKAGGVFQFLMEHLKVGFQEAVAQLAERAGIRMPSESAPGGDAGLSRTELLRLMRFAQEFFCKALHRPSGRAALEYARARQLTDAGLERFAIGYAPDSWDALERAARAAGFAERQLLAAGLVVRREQGGCYDRFRNRLMLPIIDTAGRTIAFGGRALAAEERAKYLNSPETVLFDKSSNLFGLSWARQAISDSGQAVVVEGYFDAILPAQAGVENVVATLGTSLTERHVRMLSRLAGDVVLLFDSDAAGAAAAERAMELFIQQQVNVRIAAVPEGKDPCDFVLSAGAEALRRLIADAPDALEYAWQQRQAAITGGQTLVERRRAAEEFLRLVAGSGAYGVIGPVQQGFLANRLADVLRLSPEEVNRTLRRLARRVPRASGGQDSHGGGAQSAPAVATGTALAQRQILEVLIAVPDHFDYVARHVSVEDFTEQRLARLARELWRLGEQGELSLEALLACPRDEADWGTMVADFAMAAHNRGNHEATLAQNVELLEHHRHRLHLGELRRQALDGQADEDLRSLAERLRRPDGRRRPRVP